VNRGNDGGYKYPITFKAGVDKAAAKELFIDSNEECKNQTLKNLGCSKGSDLRCKQRRESQKYDHAQSDE